MKKVLLYTPDCWLAHEAAQQLRIEYEADFYHAQRVHPCAADRSAARRSADGRHVPDEKFAGLIANTKSPQAIENQGFAGSQNTRNSHLPRQMDDLEPNEPCPIRQDTAAWTKRKKKTGFHLKSVVLRVEVAGFEPAAFWSRTPVVSFKTITCCPIFLKLFAGV